MTIETADRAPRAGALDLKMLETLSALVKPDTVLCAILRKQSRSGETDTVDLLIAPNRNHIMQIGPTVAAALGLMYDQERNGIVLHRTSVAAVVSRLSLALFGLEGETVKWQWI